MEGQEARHVSDAPPFDFSGSLANVVLAASKDTRLSLDTPVSPLNGLSMLLTVAQRGEKEARRRAEAAALACSCLSEHARRLGGRYILYGSAARGTMGWESDLDILLDFPSGSEAEAWRAAETVCRENDVPLDIMPMAWTEPNFVDRILRESVVLG